MNRRQDVVSNGLKQVQNQIINNLKDPLFKILLENSHLTKIQAETLLIDFFTDQAHGKNATLKEKSSIRISKSVSKGSFNRTLQQSKTNVMKSVLTVMMLGYLGILNTPSLIPYIEASNRLESYMQEYYSSLINAEKRLNRELRSEISDNLKNNVKKVLIETLKELIEK
ncbi:MAG: hypothetical protein ACXACH_00245 [Candidatus Hermodarchaeia archaeon]|jgi:hypothetical protein